MKNQNLKVVISAVTALTALILASSALAAGSLLANVSVSPGSSGIAPFTGVGVAVQVSGSATGDITYKIDCSSDGIWEVNQVSSNTYFSASNVCNYATAGNYTLTVREERGGASSVQTMVIPVLANLTPALPVTDLKVNNFDGAVILAPNTPLTLSWTSTNAATCTASGDWSGNKALSGSENLGTLSGSKNFVLTCSAAGSNTADSVTVTPGEQESLNVVLEAMPNSGAAPLNNVDLKATVSGSASGTINYKFDCTSDGTWDYVFNAVNDNPKTVVDACNYAAAGTYTAKVLAERGSSSAQNTTQVLAGPIIGTSDLIVSKTVRNMSDGTSFADQVAADPGEVVQFGIVVTANSSSVLNNLVVRDTLPDKMTYAGNLTIDGMPASGDILSGLNIGNLNPQQSKTIFFQAQIAQASSFNFGATDLINAAIAYNNNLAKTDSATVRVSRGSVAGATTVPTGVFDSIKLAFWLSLLATFALTYLFLLGSFIRGKVYSWGVTGAIDSLKDKMTPKEDPQQKLVRLAKEIRERENL